MIEGPFKYYISLDNFSLKWALVLQIPLRIFFDSRNTKMASEFALKPTGIKL